MQDEPLIDESQLPPISAEDREYVRLLVCESGTQLDRWRRAYPEDARRYAAREDRERAAVAERQMASYTARRKDIREWVSAYMRWGMAEAKCTMADHMARLMQLSEEARAKGNYAAAVNAEISRGRAAGLYTERIETTDTTLDPVELYRRAKEELGQEAADRWAVNKGYDHLIQRDAPRVEH